jgi:Mn2+/Fe2+ NRAMP family transporter
MRVAVYTESDTRTVGNRDNKQVMSGVAEAGTTSGTTATDTATVTVTGATMETPVETTGTEPRDVEVQDVEYINMANGWVVGIIGWLIWAFIAGLNVYLIVMLGLGQG